VRIEAPAVATVAGYSNSPAPDAAALVFDSTQRCAFLAVAAMLPGPAFAAPVIAGGQRDWRSVPSARRRANVVEVNRLRIVILELHGATSPASSDSCGEIELSFALTTAIQA
jgi:hypothetical protein